MSESSATKTPYFRLSGFYFFYFATLGAFLPYWGLYLKDIAFTPLQIGEVMAVVMGTKIIAPNLWGWLADHSGKRVLIIQVAAMFATLAFSALLFFQGYWWVMLVMVIFSFFWNAALPQFEATTMNHLGEGTHHYSKIRLWGSVGFIVSVAGLAPLFDRFGVQWLPIIVLLLLAGIWLNTLLVKERPGQVAHVEQASLIETLSQPVVIALLVTCFLAQASHGPYYAFFSIYLQDHGYSTSLIGQLWALGVAAEVGVFLLMHRWLPHYGARYLLLAALLITAVRWFLIAAWVDSLPVLLFAQLMHAASFGILHASAIHLIHQLFPGRLQGRGQALYSSLSFGLGGAVGIYLSGRVWVAIGPEWIYVMGAVLAAAAFMVAWVYIRQHPVHEA